MKIVFGVLSLLFGLLSLKILGYLSWIFHSTIHEMTAAGEGDLSPTIVSGLLPIALPLIILGFFFGLFRIKRRSKLGRVLSLMGIASSIAAILVVTVPFFFLP